MNTFFGIVLSFVCCLFRLFLRFLLRTSEVAYNQDMSQATLKRLKIYRWEPRVELLWLGHREPLQVSERSSHPQDGFKYARCTDLTSSYCGFNKDRM